MAKNTHDFKPIEGKYVNLREVTIDDAALSCSCALQVKR